MNSRLSCLVLRPCSKSVLHLGNFFHTPVRKNAWSFMAARNFSVKVPDFSNLDLSDPKNRPFSLPPGKFRPKQSLGQNFLSDQNYVMKIVDAFSDNSKNGHKVVEIGPGPGALTRVLFPRYPDMTGIEIDQRAVEFLGRKLPGLKVIHEDVLKTNWAELAASKGGRLNVIGNLPYYIVSQVLFSLVDARKCIDRGVFTMQLEVAERICAKPNTKTYGIPSVVFQLYCKPTLNFEIPPTVFYPKPKVDSGLVTFDFKKYDKEVDRVNPLHLRKVVTTGFNQRRKMLRQSLKDLLEKDKVQLPERWSTLRPDQLSPRDFVQLTLDLYGEKPRSKQDVTLFTESDREFYDYEVVWRASLSNKEPKKPKESFKAKEQPPREASQIEDSSSDEEDSDEEYIEEYNDSDSDNDDSDSDR